MDKQMDEYMRGLGVKIGKDAEENMLWLCCIDTEIEISDINPLTGKPLGEPFFLCDLEEDEEEDEDSEEQE